METETQVEETKKKSRRPANNAFRQQRLKSFQPILTPKTVIPLFFIIGLVFIPLGALLLYASNKVQNMTIDYTNCDTQASSTFTTIPPEYVSYNFRGGATPSMEPVWRVTFNQIQSNHSGIAPLNQSTCYIRYDIPTLLTTPVLMYYKMTNFYQNHRRYVKSISQDQLKGDAVPYSSLNSGDSCSPLPGYNNTPYYPCGLIANSLFNDTFSSPVAVDSGVPYEMTNKGIAWSSDANIYGPTSYNASEILPPPNWYWKYPNGYTEENLPQLETWEEFQVWMRTAALSTFSKLALRNDTVGMEPGLYETDVVMNYPVSGWGGTKSIVFSTRTIVGGKNPFIGIAYIVVGGICTVLGLIFTLRHLIKPRKLGDHNYLSWNNVQNQPQTSEQGSSTSRSAFSKIFRRK